jgi:DNA modification methylase
VSEPVRILIGDVLDGLRTLDAGSVQCCVTSPPYLWLRDYGIDGQIGLEATPDAYVAKMVDVFREVRRVLRDDGVCFLNLGDSYFGGDGRNRNGMAESGVGAGKSKPGSDGDLGIRLAGTRPTSMEGMKPKSLMMIPWRVALALQADGWYLRSVIVWAKKSPMPESVTDRPTSSWEPIFLLAKGERYFYDAEAVKEQTTEASGWAKQRAKGEDTWKYNDTEERIAATGGNNKGTPGTFGTRNQRNVWHLGPEPYSEAHFATFPTEIPRRAILAGTSEKGACPDCGAPWKRITSREKLTRERPNDFTKRDGEEGTGNSCANTVAGVATKTLGWEPTCKCGNPNTVPCVVLDPFLGSGTTIAVARTLGRHGVGCELNPAYAELARERIGKAERPSTFVSAKAEESPLFLGGAA